MPDALAPRMKFAVIAPVTNTVVQPEFDAMRPQGVSNQMMRVEIPDTPIGDDVEFATLMEQIRNNIEATLVTSLGCAPGAMIMAMSVETFWDGLLSANDLKQRFAARAGIDVVLGTPASLAAMQRFGGIRKISIITPYMPSGDAQVRRVYTDAGFEVVNLLGLKCASPLLMAHEPEERLRRAVREVDDPSVELILQLGTNLAFVQVAAEAERWLGKPVLAINACTYWHALRQNGIDDKVQGVGSLLSEH